MKVLTAIPSRYDPDRLAALVRIVAADGPVLVLDNGHDDLDLMGLVDVADCRGWGLYAMWNEAWRIAGRRGFDALCLLNDDVQLLPGTVPYLARALWSDKRIGVTYPDKYTQAQVIPDQLRLDVVTDPARERTLTGFAFCARLAMFADPPFDESWHWWYGDDAFDERVRTAGYGVARVIDLPVQHESDSERDGWARRPELRKLAEQDAARWAATHP